MDATTTLQYIELLEKTNQQLSLWYNPYALMIGILTLLVALLAIYFAYILWRQGRDYKDFLLEQKQFIENQTKLHASTVLGELLTERLEEFKSKTGEERKKIEKEIENLTQAIDTISMPSTVSSKYYEPSIITATSGGRLRRYTGAGLSEPQTQSIIALLQSFNADMQAIRDVEKTLRGVGFNTQDSSSIAP